jgi:hypothetical protein
MNPFDRIKLHRYLNRPLSPELHTISGLHSHLWDDMSITIPGTHDHYVILHKKGKFLFEINPSDKKIYYSRDIFNEFNETGIFDERNKRRIFIIQSLSSYLKTPFTDFYTVETDEIYAKTIETLCILDTHHHTIPIFVR